MSAPAISQRPFFSGRPGFFGKPAPAARPQQGKAFAAKLESFLSGGVKRPDNEGNGGPPDAFGGLIQAGLNRLGAGRGSGAGLQGIRAKTDQLKQNFEAGFRQLLVDGGFDIGNGVNLQVDSTGTVRVTNDHPQKMFIESALQNNPKLTDLFKQISTNSRSIRKVDKMAAFQSAYQEDPQAALKQYQSLFNGQAERIFNLLITDNGSKESFSQIPASTGEKIL